MENKIILSRLIENNFEKLGFSNVENKEIVRYFLKKNIITIFGKDIFEPYELEFNTIAEQELDFTTRVAKKRKRNKLQISFGGDKYIVNSYREGVSLGMSSSNSLAGFRMIGDENKVYNSCTIVSETEIVSEYSCIYSKSNFYFDYQKIIYNTYGEEMIFPAYRAKAIFVKNGQNQLFEIIKLADLENIRKEKNSIYEMLKQNIKKYIDNLKMKTEIVAIPYSHADLDNYDNLDVIFRMLEEKTEELSKVRKRIKEN